MVLTIKNKSEVLYLHLSNILYIHADGNYCDIYLADGDVLKTITYQWAEIAKMMDEQIPEDIRKRFVLVGKSYMVNTDYVLRIQPSKQLLTFMVNQFGTTRKVSIKVTTKALSKLAKEMEMQTDEHAFRTP